MKIEDIPTIQEKLDQLKAKIINLKNLDEFLERLKTSNSIGITSEGRYLNVDNVNVYGFVGKEVLEILESKKTILEKEIHNFTLDQLLPEKIKEKDFGFKFKTDSSYESVDDGVYYFKVNEDGSGAIASWFIGGKLDSTAYQKSDLFNCENNFKSGKWIKL